MEKIWRRPTASRAAATVATAAVATGAEIQHYRTHGFTVVKNAASPALVERVRRVLDSWAQRTIDDWVRQGLLSTVEESADLPFERRLLVCWEKAGRPSYSRSPRRDLVSEDMYDVLTDPALMCLARQLMAHGDGGLEGDGELMSHSVFNARPKLPDQVWTDTPWHMDSQYYEDAAVPGTHVLSIWIPTQPVGPENSVGVIQCATDNPAFLPTLAKSNHSHSHARLTCVTIAVSRVRPSSVSPSSWVGRPRWELTPSPAARVALITPWTTELHSGTILGDQAGPRGRGFGP